jgi:hypothetical protein
MPRKKIDGVIEAVRYTPDGIIDFVRAYERRGAIWSDNLLLQRAELVERIAKGKKFFTGWRKVSFGSQFEAGEPVKFDNNVVTTGDRSGGRDLLNGVPVF